ncbi:anhydro-N-acetylmuramic acid kinase [soil metagenome]
MRIAAMISGTSHDAIDVAVADLAASDGELALRPLGSLGVPFDDELRAGIVAALPPSTVGAEALCRLDTRLGQAFAAAAERAVATVGEGRVDLVVSHGQTIFHWVDGPQALGTLQLGQPAWIAERTGLPVVADLRSRDIAAGGHGAPLVSLFDVLLLRGSGTPAAALNLGGIANVTIVGPDPPTAFDVGPANALLDAAVVRLTDGRDTYDEAGRRAARGTVDERLLAALLADPYYALEPPKSTGKEHFHADYLQAALAENGEPAGDDLLATLAELTARTVAAACRAYGVARVVASGGGVANATVMGRLSALLPGVEVGTIERWGVDPVAKEAYAFAVLGFLTVNAVPGVVASCTGAHRASVLGAVLPGADGRLPARSAPEGWQPERLLVRAGG